MRRFYSPPETFADCLVTLNADESKHLRNVLRLSAGDEVLVFDGEGRSYQCTVENTGRGKDGSSLRIAKELSRNLGESPLDLTLAIGLLKGEKFDLAIQKAVELGVKQIIPLETHRTDVKLKDAAKKRERWERIALEATKQCGRTRLTKIQAPVSFNGFLTSGPENTVMFSERGGKPLGDMKFNVKQLTSIIGPEGGWDDVEIEAANNAGIQIVTIGGRILRAETAVMAIAALLQNKLGDLN